MSQPSLKDIYKSLEKMNTNEILAMIHSNAHYILPELKKLGDDNVHIFAVLVYAIAGADGKVRPEEFLIIKPLMDATFGIDCTIEDAEDLVLRSGLLDKDIRGNFRNIIAQIGNIDSELAYRMVLVAMCVAAIDGDISRREKAFIESLI